MSQVEEIKEVIILFSTPELEDIKGEKVVDIPQININTPAIKENNIMETIEKSIDNIKNANIKYNNKSCSEESEAYELCNNNHLIIDEILLNENNHYGGFRPVVMEQSDSTRVFYPTHPDSVDGFLDDDNIHSGYKIKIPLATTIDEVTEFDTEESQKRFNSNVEHIHDLKEFDSSSNSYVQQYIKIERENTYSQITSEQGTTHFKTVKETKNVYYFNYHLQINVRFKRPDETTILSKGILAIVPDRAIVNYTIPQYSLNTDPSPNIFGLGNFYVDYGTVTEFIIAEEYILEMSQNILTFNGEIAKKTKPLSAKETIQDQKFSNKDIDSCLMDDDSVQENKQSSININNILKEVEKLKAAITSNEEITATTFSTPNINQTQKIVTNNKPLLLLNYNENICVYIIDDKIQLTMPPSYFAAGSNTIIDYDIVPGQIYFLKFTLSMNSFQMDLIAPDKSLHTVNGSRGDFEMSPLFIGRDKFQAFCGLVIYDMVLGNGRISNIVKIYKEKILSFVPAKAAILFDFEKVKNGRISNNLNKNTNLTLPTNDQKANVYGEIVTNGFANALHGNMDNFFCQNNLTDTSFSISFWVNSLDNFKNRHVLLSDDVGQNYIYYNFATENITMEFGIGANKKSVSVFLSTNMLGKTWTQFILTHDVASTIFTLHIKSLDNQYFILNIDVDTKFQLMSLMTEYDYSKKIYTNNFNGYLANVSIYMYILSMSERDELFDNQSKQLNGLMMDIQNTSEVIDNNQSIINITDDNIEQFNAQKIKASKEFARFDGYYEGISPHEFEKVLKGQK